MLLNRNYRNRSVLHVCGTDGYKPHHAVLQYQPQGKTNTGWPYKEVSGLFMYWNRNGTRSLSTWKRGDDDDDDDPMMWWWLCWWCFIQRSFR